MRWRRVAFVMLLALAVAPAARSGHELPVYPSYYPHEIEIATLAPERAAAAAARRQDARLCRQRAALCRGAAGHDPVGRVARLAGDGARQSVVARMRREEASACAAVRAVARAIAANDAGVILHPYPVTPLHGDYLHHVDLAEDAKASLLDATQAAPPSELKVKAAGAAKRLLRRRSAPDAWDVEIAEIDVDGARRHGMTAINGWLGPPALKSGWYQAYLALRDASRLRARGNGSRRRRSGSCPATSPTRSSASIWSAISSRS